LSVANDLTSNTGVISDSDTAVLVEGDGGDFASTSSAVLVVTVVSRHRIVIVVVDIRAGLVIIVEREIRMIGLDAVIQNRNDDTLAGIAFLPGGAEIHIITVLGAAVLQQQNVNFNLSWTYVYTFFNFRNRFVALPSGKTQANLRINQFVFFEKLCL